MQTVTGLLLCHAVTAFKSPAVSLVCVDSTARWLCTPDLIARSALLRGLNDAVRESGARRWVVKLHCEEAVLRAWIARKVRGACPFDFRAVLELVMVRRMLSTAAHRACWRGTATRTSRVAPLSCTTPPIQPAQHMLQAMNGVGYVCIALAAAIATTWLNPKAHPGASQRACCAA